MPKQLIDKHWINFFHKTAVRVPAYAKFLHIKKFDLDSVKSWQDWAHIPVTDKKNYLHKFQLKDVCWSGSLADTLVYTCTSGSTGKPTYFPRNGLLDKQYASILEKFLKNSSTDPHKPTLFIVAFGMGVWIGGLFTYQAVKMASEKSRLPVSIITPGVNKEEIFKALQSLAPQYHQTILAGYPPFIKDVVDEAIARKINLRRLNMRFLFAAESFTEAFRDYLAKKAGIKDPLRDTLNIYGSADIGAMANETPVAILIRRLASKNKALFENIFSNINKTPTLAQFNPKCINFEEVEGQVILTGNSAVPLIRYALGDNGGVLTWDKMAKILHLHGIDLSKEITKAGIEGMVDKNPFVFVYERADFSVSLYGILLYPEFVKECLLSVPQLTGRFTMTTKYDRNQSQYLEINVEARKGVKLSTSSKKKIAKTITDGLRKRSSEFRELSNHLQDRELIKLVFWHYEHPEYFKAGIKQKWVQK